MGTATAGAKHSRARFANHRGFHANAPPLQPESIRRPDAVFIKFGMNDCGADPAGLDAYDRNRTELIRKTRETGTLPILVTQNVILYDREDGAPHKVLLLYMARAREVAAREKTPPADCFALWQPLLANRQQLVLRLNDGIHPNLAGHRLLAKGILQALWPDAAGYVSDVPCRTDRASHRCRSLHTSLYQRMAL